MYWTNEDLLSIIAGSLFEKPVDGNPTVLGPSSTIVLEFSTDKDSGEVMVKGFLDDNLTNLRACSGTSSCKASDFKDQVKSKV